MISKCSYIISDSPFLICFYIFLGRPEYFESGCLKEMGVGVFV